MTDILELFQGKGLVKVCAPMVRYSKLPFRSLVRKYGCDLCFTPMILADSFVKSANARDIEFTTNQGDTPLVVQFAANNAFDFVSATEFVSPFSNGVDLNCGCPQRWAMKEGYGADLLTKPHLIKDLVLQVRNRISRPYSVSVKIRIVDDIEDTINLCRNLEAAGTSFVTVHARTPRQGHTPINTQALCDIRASVQLPIIANGDVKTLAGAKRLHEKTGCQGVMAAQGMLTNPALFAGFSQTPVDCVQSWVDIATHSKVSFQCFHHHLVFMLEKVLPKRERVKFNKLKSAESILEFLADYYGIHCEHRTLDWFGGGTTGCSDEKNQGSYFTDKITSCNNEILDDPLDGAFSLFSE